ncbi:MAG: hypothetical protein COU06_02065 [Candidatus Harrisonbacteria bacterium CG10_big_fil_rev_8_21_14_0_10_38_8]|uniref:Uncharacterized protein n=1 Tax=Candidatus Harrisonbacteria bacterium CG10_big_fil_rev_8_21_14_0_10_38_8 TaxID=1974582 RepID=A0A2M6WJV7_9BACT|nr:MAG: hypothetical protein COU06_02065 [Candidatus Harrisonbacteria bacterium CG10_big_fil_rev_8_21_14_0_10_38_8]
MKKTLIILLGVIVITIVIAGRGSLEKTDLSTYFKDRMNTLGVIDVGQPIEGFDANLLITAFPGFLPEDFQGVEAFGGHYEVTGADISFVPDNVQPITSAAQTVSDDGYVILLNNLSLRLDVLPKTNEDIDSLIIQINTTERLVVAVNQTATALGVTITPLEVLEDSRCPVDVQCIQAGTVRLRAGLVSGLGEADQEFTLNKPVTTEAEEIVLVSVMPEPMSTRTISLGEYQFFFEVKKR